MTNMIVIIILGAGILCFIINQYWWDKYTNETTYWKKEVDFLTRQCSWLDGKYLEQLRMIEMLRKNNHESNIS